MDSLLDKLRSWIRVIQAALIGTIVIEAALVIIIGIASNKISESLNYWFWILLSCTIVYIFLLIIKTLYQLKFPGSIAEELQAKRQLEQKNQLFERQKAINEFIDTAIKGLNEQTCFITGASGGEHLCDQELGIRLRQLLEPIISYTDVILDTSTEKKFTIGIHLETYQKFPDNYESIELNNYGENPIIQDYDLISDKGVIILCDDLNLSDLLPKQLLDLDMVKASQYEIQTAIKRTLNNLAFTKHDFTEKDIKYSIICSEILEVCSDDYSNGVLFIVFKEGITFPKDVPDILSIFNRVTANYVSKYNGCIIEEIISRKMKNPPNNN
ncbi:MAG TPA: hypothetical protein VL053_11000 [Arachidicoccus sp.]|nr:hypothetical protein [Arachidicoccus sp.]